MKPMARRHDDKGLIDLDKWFGRAMLFLSGAVFVLGLDLALRVAG